MGRRDALLSLEQSLQPLIKAQTELNSTVATLVAARDEAMTQIRNLNQVREGSIPTHVVEMWREKVRVGHRVGGRRVWE